MSDKHSKTKIGLLAEWKREVDLFTLRLVEAIPSERSSFRPVESVMTLSQLVYHLADCEVGLDRDLIRNLPLNVSPPELSDQSDVIRNAEYLKDVFTFSDTIVRGLSDSDLCKEVTFPGGGTRITVERTIRTMIEHQLHHRGQVLTYLRCLGLQPPRRWSD